MSLGEFDLIARTSRARCGAPRWASATTARCSRPAPGMQLAVSSDMLVEGRHFLSTVAPERLGHKALAVNLSDLAACGAQPLAFTLALALPRADEALLAGFARGLFALADAHGMRAGRRRHHAGPAEHLHHRVRRGAGRAGAAALGRARRRRPLGQRHARRRAAGAGGLSRHARAGRRGLRSGAPRDGAAAAARRARPGAARHRHAARST